MVYTYLPEWMFPATAFAWRRRRYREATLRACHLAIAFRARLFDGSVRLFDFFGPSFRIGRLGLDFASKVFFAFEERAPRSFSFRSDIAEDPYEITNGDHGDDDDDPQDLWRYGACHVRARFLIEITSLSG